MELKEVLIGGNGKAKTNGYCAQDGSTAPLLNARDETCSRQNSVQSTASSSDSFLKVEKGHHRNRRRERLNTELIEAATRGDSEKVER